MLLDFTSIKLRNLDENVIGDLYSRMLTNIPQKPIEIDNLPFEFEKGFCLPSLLFQI